MKDGHRILYMGCSMGPAIIDISSTFSGLTRNIDRSSHEGSCSVP